MKPASLLLVLLVCGFAVAQTPLSLPKIVVLPQPDSPIALRASATEVGLSVNDRHAALNKFLVGYRLGWFADGRGPTLGTRATVPSRSMQMRPGTGLRVSTDVVLGRHRNTQAEIELFVYELRFSDGTTWKADIRRLENEAGKRARRKTTVT